MQFLRNLVEKQKTLYHAKDSRFHKVWPLFDAFETFLFAPDHRSGTGSGAFYRTDRGSQDEAWIALVTGRKPS